ncbi:MAG: class II glutamine amidotransferase, partial [Candidatus Delongbacteria bacterium]
MCGILGYIGNRDCVRFLIDGLKRVEYRGYDSAGIMVYSEADNKYSLKKKKGRIIELERDLDQNVRGSIGIGHTRWATHGEPNDVNSHPHVSNDGRIFIVHNGVIENYMTIRKKLEKHGFSFYSETDTEVLVDLIQYYYKGDIESAVKNALRDVKGTYGIGVFCLDEPDRIIAAR